MDHCQHTITEKDFFTLCDSFEEMSFQAMDYAPTVEELLDIAFADLPKYFEFLVWIDETGYDTPYNKESRKLIRDFLNESIIII